MNAVEIEEAISLLSEQAFDPTEFPYSFLESFGNKSTTIKRLRTGNNNKSDIDGGVLQHNNIHIAVCDEGQVIETLKSLKESPATAKAKAKFILATDGKDFQAEDLTSGETVACDYSDFHNHFGFFLPLAGISTVKQIRENSFDIKATSRLNKLYIELLRHNPDWATSKRRHDMNHFLARLIFCFFAEDTDIFSNDLFTTTVQKMSASDASDTHEIIGEIFRAMDIKKEERSKHNVRNWANDFPYVNGHLFSGSTETPKFTKIARSYLLHVGNLDWKKINPDIFGSMIQAVADDDERGALGMHYTSVPNILKVLNPLFLNDLRVQLEEAGDNARKLLNLRKRISRIRVFDPACGSGNFLVIAYKHLREIEYEINKRRGELDRLTEIPLTNFRGIELRDFSAEVARLALIIAEYQCNVLYRGQKLALAEFLPLNAENWITCGNALRINWLSICPPTSKGVKLFREDLFSTPLDQAEIDFENEGGDTFVCGNPPYRGSSWQTSEQKSDLKELANDRLKSWKNLDYVAGWLLKGAEYLRSTDASFAFVTTKTICEGEQVPVLWRYLYSQGLSIDFAHTPFNWSNLAAKKAGVTVVIIGVVSSSTKSLGSKRRLFTDNEIRLVDTIGPYLAPGTDAIVSKSMSPIDQKAKMLRGNMPTDGGNLILTRDEAFAIISKEPSISKFIRPFMGAVEVVNARPRFCFWIEDNNYEEAIKFKVIEERVVAVSQMRLNSNAPTTRTTKVPPYRFMQIEGTAKKYTIAVPAITSVNRDYLPVALVEGNIILSNKCYAIYDAPLWNFALASSKIHQVWIGTVCARMRSDFSYSNTLGWNTFPVPALTDKNREDLLHSAEEILIARERHFPATIADLYDPENMPEDLRQAHERNDEVLERIYIGRRFRNDTERLEKLFELYTKMTSKGKVA